MSMEDRIRAKLMAAFEPERLEIENESQRHAGHLGGPAETGETHSRVTIASSKFQGLSRIDRHRLVNEALAAEFTLGVHALALKTETP